MVRLCGSDVARLLPASIRLHWQLMSPHCDTSSCQFYQSTLQTSDRIASGRHQTKDPFPLFLSRRARIHQQAYSAGILMLHARTGENPAS